MGYYSDFENDLYDMYFDTGVLTEDMFKEFQKNIHFQNFLWITNAQVHFANTPEHDPHVTMIEFFKNGAEDAKGYSFVTDLEHTAEILNPYANAPLRGEIIRTGERTGDIEKYIINKDGTVTTQKARIVFE